MSDNYMNKYTISSEKDEILPNLLDLADAVSVAQSEFEGFIYVKIILGRQLNIDTVFITDYILHAHKLALCHMYTLPVI